MVEPATIEGTRAMFSVAIAALALAVAGFLAFTPPASTPRRLAALLLALIGLQDVSNLERISPALQALPLTVWDLWQHDLWFLALLATVALFWVYPTRVRLRSRHAAVLLAAGGLFASGALAWLVDKQLLFAGWGGPGAVRTLLFRLSLTEGAYVAFAAMMVSAAVRAQALGAAERRGAGILAAGLLGAAFWASGLGLALHAGSLLGAWDPFVPRVFRPEGVPGDCCGLGLPLYLAALAAPAAAAAVLAATRRTMAPLAVLLIGMATTPPLTRTGVDLRATACSASGRSTGGEGPARAGRGAAAGQALRRPPALRAAGAMAYDAALAERIRRVVPEGVQEREMFGGIAFLRQGRMFVGIVRQDLMVRVGPGAHDDAVSRPHVRAMDFTGRPMRGYVYIAPPGVRTEAALRRWVEQAYAHAGTLPAPKRKPARKARR